MIRGWARICRRPWTRCRRNSARRSSCAISKVCPTRRSAPPWASSSARCAAASTADGRRCASIWPSTPTRCRPPPERRRCGGAQLPALHSKEQCACEARWPERSWVMVDPRGDVFRRAFSWLPTQFASQSSEPVGPRRFRSTEHLSTEAIAAFVDGELRMTAHLRAGHHLSLCPQCAGEVDAQRQARSALRDSCPIAIECAPGLVVPDPGGESEGSVRRADGSGVGGRVGSDPPQAPVDSCTDKQ